MSAVVRALVASLLAAGCSFQPGAITGASGDADVNPDAPAGDGPMLTIDAAPDAPPPEPVTASFAVTQDTYVDSLNTSSNFGDDMNMLVDGGSQESTALLRADLTAIPTTATVQNVELHIWVSNNTGDEVDVYRMLQPWSESEATWNQRDTGMAWASSGANGASRDTAILATLDPDVTFTEKTATLDNALVQGWVTTPASNYGLALVTVGTSGSTWRTRDHATESVRPFLEITYQP